jgi:hypothetical protein
MKTITPRDLAMLSTEARGSVRQRKNLNLHVTLVDPVQRLLNAFEPGSYVRPTGDRQGWRECRKRKEQFSATALPANGNSLPSCTDAHWC